MSTAIAPGVIKELRHRVCTLISNVSAYQVPRYCQRLGLAPGDSDEAMKSKYKYAERRLDTLGVGRVLEVARAILEEDANFALTELVAKIDERNEPLVTEITRRRLLALFQSRPLATQLPEIEFIRRVWPIAEMDSVYDPSEGPLEDDIFQHTIRNNDWDTGELLTALGLLTCSKARLFKFLTEVVGPVSQTPEVQAELAAALNGVLQHDGYRLAVTGKVSGTPIYAVQKARLGSPGDEGISAALVAFNPDDVHARWTAAVDRRQDDPQGAITLARTLLEDVCKWILDEAGETYQDKDDLPVLYRKLAKTLKLAPDDYTEQTFRQLLGSCQQIVELLGSLRSKLGDAHSPGPKRSRPLPRHAELAVNLSGTMATFLVSTWQARQAEKPKAVP